MPSVTSLEISGYLDRPVPNTFVRQDDGARHLALLFPGYGYRATMPLLYYAEHVLVTHGADLLRVEYAYDRVERFQTLPRDERDLWFQRDVEAACDAGLAQGPYERITLVGKSLGTLAVGHLLGRDGQLGQAECIWLTPLLREKRLCDQIVRTKRRSLFVIGTADRRYDPTLLAEVVEATDGKSVVIEGADHSLEVAGDVLASIRAVEQMVRGLVSFVHGRSTGAERRTSAEGN